MLNLYPEQLMQISLRLGDAIFRGSLVACVTIRTARRVYEFHDSHRTQNVIICIKQYVLRPYTYKVSCQTALAFELLRSRKTNGPSLVGPAHRRSCYKIG